ncbi:MAG: glycosyl hydrolase family 5 [Hyphomicrobiaceae bacterium]
MKVSMAVAAAAFGFTMAALPVAGQAAPLPSLDGVRATSDVQTVQWHGPHRHRHWRYGPRFYGGPYWGPPRGGRCRAWRHECAARWGWGGPGFNRCLWRHRC